ncbi:MAG TPA: membrane protein insertase YidC [Bryobacteraceae bacterium]|nr:membrane protein insertase YidC [Bryobacteraceae bacterium]
MSDEQKNQQPGSKQELSTETRLLIAFALMGIVLFATPYFFKTIAPPPPAKKSSAPQQQSAVTTPATAPVPVETAPEASAARAASAQHIAAQKEQTFVVETDLYKVVFSNRGAVVHEWTLKKYTDSNGKPLELVNAVAAAKAGYPFQFFFEQKKPAADLNSALFDAKPSGDGLGITYEYAEGAVSARKTFLFRKKEYLTEVSTEVRENGVALPHLIAWRGGFGDHAITNPNQRTIFFDVNDTKLRTHVAKDAKNGPVTDEGNFSFAGIEDKYFTAAFQPVGSGPLRLVTFGDTVATAADPKEQPRVGAGVGHPVRNDFALFVGPKDIDILRQVNPKLVNVIDFGWFWFLAKPLFFALHYVNNQWLHNYGWSIIAVTILINLLLFPMRLTNLKSMKKMQVLQPQIAAINDKYKGISLRDPRKQQQNEEVMALYKKHGANPMGGCLPMLIQIPFFIAFYNVLSVSVQLRHAEWLWVTDLSQPETLAIHILPIAMIATQFFMQKMTPTTAADPSQQRMMLMMPLVMGFFFYSLPSGLVLYYMTSNLVGIAQQWFFNKTVTVADMPQPVPVTKKQSGKRR